MHRREFLKKCAVGLAASPLVCLQGLGARTPGKRKPNIILIMADDLGYECIGANGGTSYKNARPGWNGQEWNPLRTLLCATALHPFPACNS